MKKEKWIIKEIDSWQGDAIIDASVAALLKERYTPKKKTGFLMLLFSIIGALFIGTGIILIGAKNWYQLPVFLKVSIAFLPLLISQGLAVFTLKRKSESISWREASAILNTAAVFTVVAMVGQIFHLSGDFGTYVLTCGLLAMPAMFILNATSPLLIYYWTILNWAALNIAPTNAVILSSLFAIGILFVLLHRKKEDGQLVYIIWLTVIAGFPFVLIMAIMLESSLLLSVLTYFVLLLSVFGFSEVITLPFKVIGTTGTLITLAILTYTEMWQYLDEGMSIGGAAFAGVLVIGALYFAIRVFKQDKLKFTLTITLIALCVIRYIWALASLDFFPYELIFASISNVILLGVGIGFIIHGTKNINLFTTNIGMATTCILIVMRFFDSEMDIFWRGVIFLGLGIFFLLVNLWILRKKKQRREVI